MSSCAFEAEQLATTEFSDLDPLAASLHRRSKLRTVISSECADAQRIGAPRRRQCGRTAGLERWILVNETARYKNLLHRITVAFSAVASLCLRRSVFFFFQKNYLSIEQAHINGVYYFHTEFVIILNFLICSTLTDSNTLTYTQRIYINLISISGAIPTLGELFFACRPWSYVVGNMKVLHR